MRKRSNIVPPGNGNRVVKSITDLVTGNPIVEEISPIRKERNRILVPRAGKGVLQVTKVRIDRN